MKKQWVMAALLAASSIGAQATTFIGYDLNGSSSLVNGGAVIRLTDGVGADVGTAWVPGTYDLSGLTSTVGVKLTLTFDYKATTGGDGLAIVLTSGGSNAQSPSGFLGLTGVDDGLLFVLKPDVKGVGTVAISPSTPKTQAQIQAATASFNGLSDPESVNLLASPDFSADPMHVKLTLEYTKSSTWLFKLQVEQPNGSSYVTVAKASTNSLSTLLADLSTFGIGFAASSASSAATFDIYNVNVVTSLPFTATTPVPEPDAAALALAGLGVAGWMARRKRVV